MSKQNTYKQITLGVHIGKNMLPKKITWDADDNNKGEEQEVAATQLSMWDMEKKELVRFDLWQEKMPILEMKLFHINILSAMAENIKTSTGDEYMASEINLIAEKLFEYIKKNDSKKS